MKDPSHSLTLLKRSSVSLNIIICSVQSITIIVPFSATPAEINFEVVNATAVKLSWTKSQLPHLNLSHSTVYYIATKQGRVIDQFHINTTTPNVVVVMRNLMPGLVHQFQFSWSLRDATRGLLEGPRSTNRRFSFGKGRGMA